MLAMVMKWFINRPSASNTGKYFWLLFMVETRASCGTSRNSVSKLPATGTGHSLSAVTSSSRASSMSASPPSFWAVASTCARMRALRSGK